MTFDELVQCCKCSVSLTVNSHMDMYQSRDEWISHHDDVDQATLNALDPDKPIYVLQFYPGTPVGFNVVFGSSFADVLTKAAEYFE